MGNCQAVDNASFVLQTQNGRAERFYSPISAVEIMKLHPGYHVALLLTTTFYSSPSPSTTSSDHRHRQPENNNNSPTNANQPLRVTRIKLLRPTDNLVLGHAYRLITTQEVMKGVKAKKTGKLNKINNINNSHLPESAGKSKEISDYEVPTPTSNQSAKPHHRHHHHQMKKLEKQSPGNAKYSGSKSRGWHPSLNSISEATT